MPNPDYKAELKQLLLTEPFTPELHKKAWELIIDQPELRHTNEFVKPPFVEKEASILKSVAIDKTQEIKDPSRNPYIMLTYHSLRERTLLKRLGMSENEILKASIAVDMLLDDLQPRPAVTSEN